MELPPLADVAAEATSLGLAILEAMAVGVPVVGLATTELPRAIRDGESGYLSNDPDELVARMEALLADHDLARRIGAAGRAVAASS